MPCNSIAVVRIRLDANIGTEIVGQREPVEALKAELEKQYQVRLRENSGYRVEFDLSQPNRGLLVTLRLVNDGEVITLLGNASQAEATEIVAKLRPFLEQLAAAAVQRRLVNKLTTGRTVLADEKLPAGMRLVKLQVRS